MDISQRRAKLATMYYIRRFIDATLEKVIVKLQQTWDSLTEAEQIAIEGKQKQLAESIRAATTAFERGMKIEAFLRELEGFDGVLDVAYDELLEGKTSEVFRNAGGPQQSVADRLVQLLEQPPTPFSVQAVAKGIDFDDIQAFMDDAPQARGIGADLPLAETTIPLYTKVDFPAKIESTSQEEHPLVIQLVLNRPQESRIEGSMDFHFPDPQTPKLVEVKVTAPGFEERTGVWTRTMAVYSYTDSQPAIFLLKLIDRAQKPQPITVDFYHEGNNLGSFTFQTEITGPASTRTAPITPRDEEPSQPAEDEEPITLGTAIPVRAVSGIRLPSGTPTPPVDVELRITRADKKLFFTLHSARASVGYH